MSKTLSVVVADEVKEKLEEYAQKDDRNVSYVVRKAIEQFLSNLEKEDNN